MNKKTKKTVATITVLILVIGIYFITQNKAVITPLADTATESANDEIAPSDVAHNTVSTPSTQTTSNTPAPSSEAKATPVINTGTLTYKGQFFPFEFTYPRDFKLAKNLAPSTATRESKSYNFFHLAINGGVGGFVSFYVSEGNNDNLEQLVTEYPDKYTKVDMNGDTFYKYIGHDASTNNAYKVEYTTFKNNIKYRFSMVVVNGNKKDLDISTYKPEFDMFDTIIKSLKIN